MAVQYRDIGTLGGHESVLQEVDENPRTQVYMATHDGDNNRLPYMNRSFISFSYGGKLIEDFGFITITENNSMQRNLYADFEDNITESNVFDGQIYWSTHYNANTLELALFTDGVTERELEEFKRWFAPGIARELILSEHPNRAIMARIAEVPQYSMLPFEQKVKTKLAGRELETSTTCYKGRINLSFVMDDPFWYAKTNVLDQEYAAGKLISISSWKNANDDISSIFDDKDAIKIMVEDGVPCLEMKSPIEDADGNPPVEDVVLLGTEQVAVLDMSSTAAGSRVGSDDEAINGALVNQGHVAWHLLYEPGFTLTNQQALAFYYPGTAPGKPILSFKIAPTFDNSHYINNPRNSFSSETGIPYNRIYIEGQEQQIFRFTTPSIWTGYNQVMWIFNHIDETMAWEDIRQALRDNVKHYAPRLYASYLIDQIKAGAQSSESSQVDASSSSGNESNTNMDTVTPTTEQLAQLRAGMVNFLKDFSKEEETYFPAIFYFDSETGRAKGQFTYNKTPGQNLNNLGTLEEDVEDMVKSKYLSIIERNILTEDGFIGQHADDPRYSHILYHDSSTPLENLNLKYKYLYL